MKALAGVLGVLSPIVSIAAVLVRLRWWKAQHPSSPEDRSRAPSKGLRVAALVWLVAVAIIVTSLVLVMVVPAIVRLFIQ